MNSLVSWYSFSFSRRREHCQSAEIGKLIDDESVAVKATLKYLLGIVSSRKFTKVVLFLTEFFRSTYLVFYYKYDKNQDFHPVEVIWKMIVNLFV